MAKLNPADSELARKALARIEEIEAPGYELPERFGRFHTVLAFAVITLSLGALIIGYSL